MCLFGEDYSCAIREDIKFNFIGNQFKNDKHIH